MKITGLNFSYPQEMIFKELELTLPPNKLNVIVASNGRGKTTLFDILAGVIPSEYALSNVAYRTQKLRFSPYLTVRQLIELYEKMGTSSINKKYLAPLFEKYIAPKQKMKLGRLSGGQQQLILNYATLLLERDVYLLDEPLSQLDEEVATLFYEQLLELVKINQTLFVLTEHDQHRLTNYAKQVNLITIK